MIRIALVGQKKEDVHSLLEKHRGVFSLVDDNPEYVLSFGGDGTLMIAEYLYPGIPKIFLKNSHVAKLAHEFSNEEVIKRFAKGKFEIKEHIKLQASVGKKQLIGINDIVIHNADPRHAIRYTVTVDGQPLMHEVIGDGVIFATPLGSTGYYRSITDSYFRTGIGLAFNNSTEQSDHVVLRDDSVVIITVKRGPADCYADNQKTVIPLKEGDVVEVRKSEKVAKILNIL